MEPSLDLSFLTDKERRKILIVLERDAQMQKKEELRLERLKSKAEKTKNPVILKKIWMRSGQWFQQVQQNDKRFNRRGVDTVRSSIRLASRSHKGSKDNTLLIQSSPAAPVESRVPSVLSPVVEQSDNVENLNQSVAITSDSHNESFAPESVLPEISKEPDESALDSSRLGNLKAKNDHLSASLDYLKVDNHFQGPEKNQLGSTQSLNLLKPKKFGSTLSLASVKSGLFSSTVSQVTGTIKIGFSYNYSKGSLNVIVVSCSDLSMVEKKPCSPYVKTYLLPDKAKTSKRKTKIKKKTTNPVYNENLKYKITESELATRSLNVSVWHDKVGYNVFLGEINVNMDQVDLSNADPVEYDLKPKTNGGESADQGEIAPYLGEIEVALRFQTENGSKVLSDSDVGQLDAVVKKIRNVPLQGKGKNISLFVKGYFLPDRYRQTKQKSPVTSGNQEVAFDHLFSYTNVEVVDLRHRCLELSVFDQPKLGAARPIGGVRVGCGSGESLDQPVNWMDSNIHEKRMWDECLATPGTWIEGVLDLRKIESRK